MNALPFTEFVEGVLGVQLYPGQRALAQVAYDGAEPEDVAGDGRDLARRIFGDVATVPPAARDIVVIVAGARGGKSYVLAALRALHLSLVTPLTTLAPGEVAVAIIVAPALRLAQQTLAYVKGAIHRVPAIARCVVSETSETVVLQRPDGPRVAIECVPASAKGATLRGRSLVGAVLDEACFFRDSETGSINDEEVFKAVAPRVVSGGQVIVCSTPWAEAGLLYELFRANHGQPVNALAAHAPTLLLHDDAHTRTWVTRERQRDPANARREFDAEFMASGGGAFFDGNAIDHAVDDRADPLPPHDWAAVGIGADFGFRSDSSALVVVQNDGEVLRVADVLEMQPGSGAPLQPSAVVRAFAQRLRQYGGRCVIADGHYREAIREHLSAHELALAAAPEGASGKVDTYTRCRALLHEGKLRLPRHERLLRQLREVTARPLAGGGLTIRSERWARGGHGDIVSALVLAVHHAAQQTPRPPKPPVDLSDPDALNAMMAARKQRAVRELRAEQSRELRRRPHAFMRRSLGGA